MVSRQRIVMLHDDAAPEAPRSAEAQPPTAKRRGRAIPYTIATLAGGLALMALLRWLHWGEQTTDNAQLDAQVTYVAPLLSGIVARVHVRDGQRVQTDQPLFELASQDLDVRLHAAEADFAGASAELEVARASLALAQTEGGARTTAAYGAVQAAEHQMQAQLATVSELEASARALRERSNHLAEQVTRTAQLVERGALPKERLDALVTERRSAEQTLAASEHRLAASRGTSAASRAGVTIARSRLAEVHGSEQRIEAARATVRLAGARRDRAAASLALARLERERATVRAPSAGVVAHAQVEVGQRIGPERPLLAIVSGDDIWVTANFKEDQVEHMRPGQIASIRLDTYGGREFAGYVESISAASGARFALIPPDNASGNFVKVVQRVPVRIRFRAPPASLALRPGSSAEVRVLVDGRREP